jgi:hypothetical protein
MSHQTPHNAIRLFVLVLFAVLVLALVPRGSRAVPTWGADGASALQKAAEVVTLDQNTRAALSSAVAVDCSSTTCPSQASGFSGLDKCVERADFCVYYTTDSITETEADWAADQVQAYWNRFVSLGFNPPKHSGKLEVYLQDTTDCNGGTGWSINYMTTYAGCWTLGDDVAQKVLGHELTHRVQYAHDTSGSAPVQTKFLKEGTARASEDNWFTNIDHMPATGSNYCAEAAGYLGGTNTNLSALWYKSCVWWKWASEQYGTTLTEPERGVDFLKAVYDQNTAGYSGIAAVNRALNLKAPGTTFDDSFKKFAVAAYTKDLSGLPDDSYNIVDEDEVGSPGSCGAVALTPGGTIQTGTDASWNNQAISKYGARYYEADIGASCPVISASFHRDSGPAFYHVVTQDGGTFKTHVQGSGTDWTQSFLNDGVTKVVAVVGSLDNSSQVDVTLECADPEIDIKLPNTGAPAQVQSSTKFLAQVLVTNGSPTGPVVAGLTNSDFRARVGGVDAAVTGGGFIQEQYWLVIRAPAGLADGTYELEIMLEEPGTSTVIDTDTEFGAILYTTDLVDHVLVIDRSGSMGTPIEPTNDKLAAAKDAASFYVDITRNNDGLAVVAYNHNVDPTPFAMQTVNATVRTSAKNYINNWATGGIFPDGATSIGDGLYEARTQRVGSGTGNPLCSFVLLSDGMENSERKWNTGANPVKTDVQATGCPVTAIAFGPASNETLMQTIAQDTGGLSFYNDVYVSAVAGVTAATPEDMALDLGNTYEYAHSQAEDRQRIFAEKGVIVATQVMTHEVMVDNSVSDVLFALDWYVVSLARLELELVEPDGTVIDSSVTPYDFEDNTNGHVGWRISNPDPGTWKMVVKVAGGRAKLIPYQVLVSGRSDLTLHLLLPDRLGRGFFTGNRFPIFAILSEDTPIPCAGVEALVTAPDGSETRLPLFDDGEHGDGNAGDGVCANTYTRLNQALQVQPPDEGVPNPPAPEDEGGYRVRLLAMTPDFQREALGAFSVLEGDDSNSNGLPDTWETEYGVTDPNGDPDLDYLFTGDEYLAGTDPTNSDTDGGGENDGSEVDSLQDPLDPSDDEIEAPDFLEAAPGNGKVLLTYDVKTEYVKMELWRAPSPDGPWNQRVAELPLEGSYEDPAPNDTTQYYRLIAEDGAVVLAGEAAVAAPGHRSAVLDSESVTPSVDPVPPQAFVVIDNGAPSTRSSNVTLSFEPYEYEEGDPNGFDDITHALISNDPSLSGAQWQAIDPNGTVPWQLDANPGEVASVYVRFRDAHSNESVSPEVGVILYDPFVIYLPLVVNSGN